MSLKLGVIGAGAIGKEHIRRCTQVLQGATVVAVSDINADNARAAVALPGVQAEVYADGHDVINASDVDAILVTSRDPTHEEYTRPPSPLVSRCSAKNRWRCLRKAAVASSMPKSRPAVVWCRLALCARTTKAIWR